MTKRDLTLLVLAFVCLLLVAVWLFAARIASLVLTPLLSGERTQIESLQIASVGFRSIEITQISGQNRLATGIKVTLACIFTSISSLYLKLGRVRVCCLLQ